jgi:hypothetical protein
MNVNALDIESLRAEFANNRRLRAGLWLILLLTAMWVSLVWSDINADLSASTRNLGSDLLSLQEIEPVNVWSERVEAAMASVASHEEGLWRADTQGLASARLQADLYALFKEEEKRQLEIRVATPQPLEDYPHLFRVSASIGATLTADSLLRALGELEANPLRLNVEQLVVKKKRGVWTAALIVTAYFEVKASS